MNKTDIQAITISLYIRFFIKKCEVDCLAARKKLENHLLSFEETN